MAASTALEALTAELLGDVGKLHDDVKQLANALPSAADTILQAGQESAGAVKAAVDKAMVDLAKGVAEAEVAKLHAAFLDVSQKVLSDIRKEAEESTTAPYGWKIKVALNLSLVVALSSGAGAIVGSWYVKNSYERQIAAGQDFLQVLPQLDAQTKEKITRLIKNPK